MVTWSTESPRSARSSSTSRYESEKRKYQPTASRIISGSNWRHLNRPATEGARTISAPTYQSTPAKLQHFLTQRTHCKGLERTQARSAQGESHGDLLSQEGLCWRRRSLSWFNP